MTEAVKSERIAVVLVNTNEGRFLPRTLSALAEQTAPPARTLVLDNDSTDGSPAMVREKFPDVEVVELGRNAGFSVANNHGVRIAEDCDWVVLLNPDAFPEPDWLERFQQAIEANPRASLFASRMMRVHDPEEIDGAGDAYHVSGLSFRRFHARKLAEVPVALEPCETFSACGGAALYRRDAFLAAGGFDEYFFAYLEDTDLAFRLRLAGHTCVYVPDAVVHHVGSATTGVVSEYTIYHTHRNIIWAWVKGMPWQLVLLYLPQHVLVNLLTMLWFSTRGRAGTMLRAKRDALTGLPRVLRQRRELQRTRRVGAWELRRVMDTGSGTYRAAARRAAAQVAARHRG